MCGARTVLMTSYAGLSMFGAQDRFGVVDTLTVCSIQQESLFHTSVRLLLSILPFGRTPPSERLGK